MIDAAFSLPPVRKSVESTIRQLFAFMLGKHTRVQDLALFEAPGFIDGSGTGDVDKKKERLKFLCLQKRILIFYPMMLKEGRITQKERPHGHAKKCYLLSIVLPARAMQFWEGKYGSQPHLVQPFLLRTFTPGKQALGVIVKTG